ncbi:hypothetical protein HHL25_05475 [Rhizobium sp. S-51]|uniref:Uncharacterized protein n=1 Tax=Rhizobium terricola TaxID=2728849 RepID=A0A7Y0FVF8_9HYPH|nr:hypothetical protein [Rhizobium terricola]NML73574.1 hypothetical protein [Rhizobium terricola]
MTNVVNFPDRRRVEVSMCTEKEAGKPVFLFELVEGGSRNVIATRDSSPACAELAGELIAEGTDVIWDAPTRRQLFIDSGSIS